jgi:hypothetical protein
MRRLAAGSLRVMLYLIVVAVVAWSVAAIWIDGPKSRALAAVLCAVVAAGSLLLLIVVRPWWWAGVAAGVPFVIVLAWWLSIAPTNTADWQPDVARLPSAVFDGDRVTIRNVRDFTYPSPTAVVERWEERTYDLGRVEGFDMFLSNWGPKAIAHTISSWEFSDGRHLAISIETRKVKGQEYSALLGFFRQYELYYVVADERDVIRVRTNYRRDPPEDVYLYRMRGTKEAARRLFLEYVAEINRLKEHAEFYNTLTTNCTSNLWLHSRVNPEHLRYSWRLLASGHVPELFYDHGKLDTTLPFAELQKRSLINPRAIEADKAPDFSRRIREGLPGP